MWVWHCSTCWSWGRATAYQLKQNKCNLFKPINNARTHAAKPESVTDVQATAHRKREHMGKRCVLVRLLYGLGPARNSPVPMP